MCKCHFVEYTCSCSRLGCPHEDPKHLHHHRKDFIFQTDHFKWKHCTQLLARTAVDLYGPSASPQSVQSIDEQPAAAAGMMTTSTSLRKVSLGEQKWSSSAGQAAMSTVSERGSKPSAGGGALVPELPVRVSEDARHGGRIPGCEAISYEGWRVQSRSCRWCEDYWIGRREVI